jgi:hypothetical protein
MGNERFSSDAYATYSSTHKLRSSSRDAVFTSRNINQALDPSKIIVRESCDSALNPNSTPIILGLDVTGSMGFIAESIAKEGLPELMQRIYDEKPVTDPHLMFMGIGDVKSDQAPLQVSQFESGAVTLIEQLRKLWLEGNGGGNNCESYTIPWYFAAHKTAIDCFDKRGKKGYIFTIGDELIPGSLSLADLKSVFGAGQYQDAGSTEELLKLVSEKYKVFHVIAEEGSYARGQVSRVRDAWTKLLGPNVINLRDHKLLPEVIVSTLKIANGADIREVIAESQIKSDLKYAFSNAL